MSNDTEPTTLVLGGTGKTGRRVVERLRARGLPVRAGSRSGAPPFHWEDRSTWAPALRGAASAYVSYFPDLAVPGAPEAVGAFVEQALQSGTRRLVLLSGRGEEEAQRAERVLQDCGTDWTIVRCSWFSQNFSESYMLDSILAGEVALPAPDTPEPFVDAEDIADVAVMALTEDGHAGRLYELTGPRSSRWRSSRPGWPSRTFPTTRSGSCATCSRRSSTAATRTSTTACSRPSAASPWTSATMRSARRQRVSGELRDDRAALRRDAGHRPGVRAGRRSVLRVLVLRDAGAQPTAGATGHRGHAVDQPPGDHARVHDGLR